MNLIIFEVSEWVFDFFKKGLRSRINIFENYFPKICPVHIKISVCLITGKCLFLKSTWTIDDWIFGYSRVIGNNFVNIGFKKLFILFSLQKSKHSFLQKYLHFFFWNFIFMTCITLTRVFKMTTNKDGFIQTKFLSCSLKHLSLISITCDQPVNFNFVFLSYSMSSCSCLNIILRVPIRIIYNDNICTRQIYTNSSGFSWKQEDLSIFSRIIIFINSNLPLVSLYLPINPLVSITIKFQELLNKF